MVGRPRSAGLDLDQDELGQGKPENPHAREHGQRYHGSGDINLATPDSGIELILTFVTPHIPFPSRIECTDHHAVIVDGMASPITKQTIWFGDHSMGKSRLS